MSYWDSVWDCPWSDPDTAIQFMETFDMVSGALVRFQPRPGLGMYYGVCCDGYNGPVVFAPDNTITEVRVAYRSSDNNHVFSIVPQGGWASNQFDQSYQQILFQEGRTNKIWIEIPFPANYVVNGDHGQLIGWNLDGVKRFANCMPVTGRPQWAQMQINLTTVSGIHTVDLIVNGVVAASGSRAGNGTVQLADEGIGLAGSVVLNFSGDFVGGSLFIQFPAQYAIYYRSDRPWMISDFTGPTPPTPNGLVPDDGYSVSRPFESIVVAPATWYVVVHSISDSGIESETADNVTVATVYVPASPTNVAYASGAAPATVISWTASTDVASTYNIYDSGTTGILDTSTPTQTHIAGTGTLTDTLPAISPFTGTRYVLVRSLLGGVESGNINILALPYVAGVVRLPVPNDPIPSPVITVAGLMLSVNWNYSSYEEEVHPSIIQLYLWPATPDFLIPGFVPDYQCGVVGNAPIGPSLMGISSGSVSGDACYNGLYYYGLKALGPNGQSLGTQFFGPVLLTDIAPPDPSVAARGS